MHVRKSQRQNVELHSHNTVHEQFSLVKTAFCINEAFLLHEFSNVMNNMIAGFNPELAYCTDKVDQHQHAAAAHIPREFYQPHLLPPTKWVYAVQMPVNEGTLSDIRGNAAYW